MDSQHLTIIFDAISAVGVIISITYLAYQIRQNTRALRRSATREIMRDLNELSRLFVESPDLVKLYLTSNQAPQELTVEERFRFQTLLAFIFSNFDLALEYHREGLLSDPSIEVYSGSILALFDNSLVGEWWQEQGRSMYSQELRDLVSGRLV